MAVTAIESGEGAASPASHEVEDLRLGIVGAGKFGTTLARAAIAAGYDVAISGSGPAEEIALAVEVLAAGARAATTDEVVRDADIIILAVPTHRFRELPNDLFAGKILVDAMNYWAPVDGADPELTAAPNGTSAIVQERFPSARVVKSLNQLGYHQLEETSRSRGAPDRIAVGQPATTALRSRRSCRSSTGSDSTRSMPGLWRMAPRWSPTAHRSPPPTARTSSRSVSRARSRAGSTSSPARAREPRRPGLPSRSPRRD